MLVQILLAIVLLTLSAMIHAFGTAAILRLVGRHHRDPDVKSLYRPIIALTIGLLLVFVLHLIEAAIWAIAFYMLDTFRTFEEAFYFSISSFATVGFGDVVTPHHWRILGSLEAMVGIVLLGWSAGLVLVLLERTHRRLIGVE